MQLIVSKLCVHWSSQGSMRFKEIIDRPRDSYATLIKETVFGLHITRYHIEVARKSKEGVGGKRSI